MPPKNSATRTRGDLSGNLRGPSMCSASAKAVADLSAIAITGPCLSSWTCSCRVIDRSAMTYYMEPQESVDGAPFVGPRWSRMMIG